MLEIEAGFATVAAAADDGARNRALATLAAQLTSAELAALPEVDGKRVYPDTEYGRYLASRRVALDALAGGGDARSVSSLLRAGDPKRAAAANPDGGAGDCPSRSAEASPLWKGSVSEEKTPEEASTAPSPKTGASPLSEPARLQRSVTFGPDAPEHAEQAATRRVVVGWSFIGGAGALGLLFLLISRFRRSERRVLCYFPITVQSDGEDWKAMVVNISRGGAKLSGCPDSAAVGQRVEIVLADQSRAGRIAWIRNQHCGVKLKVSLTRAELRQTLAKSK